MRPEDQTFEKWHQDDSRGKKIAFSQGSDDKRLQNQALIAFEYSFHGNYARAMVCLKVCYIFCCILCSKIFFPICISFNQATVDPITFASIIGDKGDESTPKKYFVKTKTFFVGKPLHTHEMEALTKYVPSEICFKAINVSNLF